MLLVGLRVLNEGWLWEGMWMNKRKVLFQCCKGICAVVYNLVVYTRAAQALRQRTLPPRISKLILK